MRVLVFFLVFVVYCTGIDNAYAAYCLSANRGIKTSAEIEQYLSDLADNSFGFASVGIIGKAYSESGGSQKNIAALLITKNASWKDKNKKPTVIITGAIHGNEWAGPEVCLGIAEYLLENKDNDKPALDDKGIPINPGIQKDTDHTFIWPHINTIKKLLETIQIVIIPVYNPEGYDYCQTPAGRQSYYGAGWRPNRRNLKKLIPEERCYKQDGSMYIQPPEEMEHCFLADYDDTNSGGDLEEESIVVCETVDKNSLYIFEPSLRVASAEMFDALYSSKNPARTVCASGDRRTWKAEWSDLNDAETIPLIQAKKEGYLKDAFGVDMNRNFQYKWDVVEDQKHLFIRTRSPSSRMFRGASTVSEEETGHMEKMINERQVVALIDYHSGSTQVLYPYAYTTKQKVDRNLFGGKEGTGDFTIFKEVSGEIASILNRHDRGDTSIQQFSAAQNYNGTSVGSGVSRDCYYETEGIAAINIEVHNRKYTYAEKEFVDIVPKICNTNVPGALWFLFWAAELVPGNGAEK